MQDLVKLFQCEKCRKTYETRTDLEEITEPADPFCCGQNAKQTGQYTVRAGKARKRVMSVEKAAALTKSLDARARAHDTTKNGRDARVAQYENLVSRYGKAAVGPMPFIRK